MISQEEMDRVAARLSDALGTAAQLMTTRDVTGDLAADLAERRAAKRAHPWLIPLAAAAAVVAIVATSVAIARHVAGTSTSTGASTGPGGVTSLAGLPMERAAGTKPPKFIVTERVTVAPGLQVRRTSDGAVTGTVPGLPGYLGPSDVSAAASNRTFFVTEQRQSSKPVTRFYRFGVTAGGAVSGFQPVGGPVQARVYSFAAAPDGSRIAYVTSGTFGEMDGTIHVMDLATGHVRTWYNSVTAVTPARFTGLASGMAGLLSWTADGRSLIADYQWDAPPAPTGPSPSPSASHSSSPADLGLTPYLGVLALDTTSPGGALQAHSRVLFSQGADCSLCVEEALASPDGKSLTAVILQPSGSNYPVWVVRISASTGKPVSILYQTSRPAPAGGSAYAPYPLLYPDGSGRYLAVFSTRAPGWISGGKLKPIPGAPGPDKIIDFAW